MDVSKIPYKSLVGRLVRLPLRIIPEGVRMPVLTGPLRGFRWIVGSHTHGCWLGWYERDKARLFASSIPYKATVFDIGANVGFYTLLASKSVGSDGKVVSFEPLPRNIHYLKSHVQINELTNVEIIEAAVTDHAGEVLFQDASGAAEGNISNQGTLNVQAVSVDDLLARGIVPRPDVMKIDVEGGEVDVLVGAKRLLEEGVPTIFLATHGRDAQGHSVALLQNAGYSVDPLQTSSTADPDEWVAHFKGVSKEQ